MLASIDGIFIWVLALCFYQLFFLVFGVHGFQWKTRFGTIHSNAIVGNSIFVLNAVDAAVEENGGSYTNNDFISNASEKLSWEISKAKTQKPVLNLSMRDASPEEALENDAQSEDYILEWDQGQRWKITVGYLSDLGVLTDDEILGSEEEWLSSELTSSILLKDCPQLFRLEPEDVQETAQWIVEEFGVEYLQKAIFTDKQSLLLSFRKDDVAYGLEFMSLMMMTDAKPACRASSAFFLQAIQGGIQERIIGAALGAAGEATSKASRSIASDTMESFRQLRDANRHKK